METNILRVLILVVLFFLLTCEYSTFLGKLLSDESSTEVSNVDKPKIPSRKSRENSYDELSLNDVINDDEEEDDDYDEDDYTDSELDQKSVKSSKSTFQQSVKKKMISTMKNSCLPKLICELNASTNKDALSDGEKSLLRLIRETSIGMTAEVTSKYHFAAHMGQLISGIDGNGCHNFYPSCPLPGVQILNLFKKDKIPH